MQNDSGKKAKTSFIQDSFFEHLQKMLSTGFLTKCEGKK